MIKNNLKTRLFSIFDSSPKGILASNACILFFSKPSVSHDIDGTSLHSS